MQKLIFFFISLTVLMVSAALKQFSLLKWLMVIEWRMEIDSEFKNVYLWDA